MRATRLASIASCARARTWVLKPRPVHGSGNRQIQPLANLWLLSVANGLDQQIAERTPLELELAEHVENLATGRGASLVELLEQCPVDVALAGFLGDEVPEVADLRMADAVNPPEALLQPVRVPGQVVVDHQMVLPPSTVATTPLSRSNQTA